MTANGDLCSLLATDAKLAAEARFPPNVGILAADIYTPKTFVAQADLERADNMAAGKYTIGLGQDEMAITGDREDINRCVKLVPS